MHGKASLTIHKLLELLSSVYPSEGNTPPPAKQTVEAVDVNVKKLVTAIKKARGQVRLIIKIKVNIHVHCYTWRVKSQVNVSIKVIHTLYVLVVSWKKMVTSKK